MHRRAFLTATAAAATAATLNAAHALTTERPLGATGVPLPAPVASPTALGGTPMIAPVVYDGTPAHPWQSQCAFGAPTPNVILHGDLVASWSTETC